MCTAAPRADFSPQPDTEAIALLLEAAIGLPGRVAAMLEEPAARFSAALEAFEASDDDGVEALVTCADTYQLAISYLSDIGFESLVTDNASRFTRDYVIGALERDLGAVHGALREAYLHNAEIPRDEILRMYRRLPWTFACEISSFQRKRYVNMSHEPNKAVNLNSYIGLISGAYREVGTEGRNEPSKRATLALQI